MSRFVLSDPRATSHLWLLSTYDVAEELNFNFYLILIHYNLKIGT